MLTDLKDSGGVLGEINPFRIFGMQPWFPGLGSSQPSAAVPQCTSDPKKVDLLDVTLVHVRIKINKITSQLLGT